MTILTVIIIIVVIGMGVAHMPRALTEQEKCRICQKLLEKGKDVVFSHGIRKVSVDDIAKAAGIAKGSFYQHFQSKEKYLYELIMDVHRQVFSRAEQMLSGKDDPQAAARDLIVSIFHMPEIIFFTRHYHEISEFMESMSEQEIQSANQMEADMFKRLLMIAGIDINRVKPGVVHNYIHTLYIAMGSDFMVYDDLPETIELILDSLIAYAFGGAQ